MYFFCDDITQYNLKLIEIISKSQKKNKPITEFISAQPND